MSPTAREVVSIHSPQDYKAIEIVVAVPAVAQRTALVADY